MGETDGGLLKRFASGRDETAFEELVKRHGGMVFGVCERILGSRHDAEDSFQAAFVVLARNARRLRKAESVASWLHGIALRVALNARRRAARLRERERQAAEMTAREAEPDRAWQGVRSILDDELGRMPERLRAPLVLCYLESKTNEEAASELGWSDGQLRGRLAKGREVLRKRLARKGVVLSTAVLFAAVSKQASAAVVPQACVVSSVQAAAAVLAGGSLASGVMSSSVASLAAETMKALALAKLKAAAAACALSAAVLISAGLGLRHTFTAVEHPAAVQSASSPPTAATVTPANTLEPEPEGAVAPPEPEGAPLPGAANAFGILLPDAVLDALRGSCPGATISEVEEEEEDGLFVYEVHLDANGRASEVVLTPDGRVVSTEEKVEAADLPRAVSDAVAALYPASVIVEAGRITEGDANLFKIDLRADGRKIKVKLKPDGQVIEHENEGGLKEDAGTAPPEQTGREIF